MLRKLDVFRFGLFLMSSATDIVLVTLPSTAVETAIAQCTSRCAMARGHRLNTSIVLAAVHGLSGLFRAVSAVEPSLSRPPAPVPNKLSRFCGRKAIWMVKVYKQPKRRIQNTGGCDPIITERGYRGGRKRLRCIHSNVWHALFVVVTVVVVLNKPDDVRLRGR